MKKILLADSIQESRNKLKRSLSTHGLPAMEVSLGSELMALNHEDVMLVIISQNLQDMSAFDVLKRIRQENPYFREIPFIICTADNSDSFYRQCLNFGFRGVLYRPFSRKAVFSMVKNIMIEVGIADEDMFAGQEQVEAINDEERLDFLKYLLTLQSPVILPQYNAKVNVAYYYPLLTDFFALDPGDEFDILQSYRDQNIVVPKLENRVNLCPRCSFHTLNFREECPKCGELDIHIEEVLHHFSCGYVGPASDFTDSLHPEMICPKCGKQLRHIGLDYEKPTNTYVCHTCEYVFNDPQLNFNCFSCNYTGKAEEVVVRSIYSYTPGQKAYKIVEHNSFNVFQLDELITMDEYACHNMDFFNFMLQRDYLSAGEYGDRLSVMIVAVKDINVKLINHILDFIRENKKAADTVSVDIARNIMISIPRQDIDDVTRLGHMIQKFVRSDEHSLNHHACIFIRELNRGEKIPGEELLKAIIEDFDAHCSGLPEEIIISDGNDED
ncbi:MAG: response regulator [Victivallales bacterium]|nr:response regulator [Victivallales bacterium]